MPAAAVPVTLRSARATRPADAVGPVADPKYDKHGFMIHDYFFAKTLDQVRPGGVVAFVTSKGTLDKTKLNDFAVAAAPLVDIC